MAIQTSAMKAASGATIAADQASVGAMLRRPASAKTASSARTTARPVTSRAIPAAATSRMPKMTAPFGVIGSGRRLRRAQHRDELARRCAIEQGGEQDLHGLV